jgi:hypothetical protein
MDDGFDPDGAAEPKALWHTVGVGIESDLIAFRALIARRRFVSVADSFPVVVAFLATAATEQRHEKEKRKQDKRKSFHISIPLFLKCRRQRLSIGQL